MWIPVLILSQNLTLKCFNGFSNISTSFSGLIILYCFLFMLCYITRHFGSSLSHFRWITLIQRLIRSHVWPDFKHQVLSKGKPLRFGIGITRDSVLIVPLHVKCQHPLVQHPSLSCQSFTEVKVWKQCATFKKLKILQVHLHTYTTTI